MEEGLPEKRTNKRGEEESKTAINFFSFFWQKKQNLAVKEKLELTFLFHKENAFSFYNKKDVRLFGSR